MSMWFIVSRHNSAKFVIQTDTQPVLIELSLIFPVSFLFIFLLFFTNDANLMRVYCSESIAKITKSIFNTQSFLICLESLSHIFDITLCMCIIRCESSRLGYVVHVHGLFFFALVSFIFASFHWIINIMIVCLPFFFHVAATRFRLVQKVGRVINAQAQFVCGSITFRFTHLLSEISSLFFSMKCYNLLFYVFFHDLLFVSLFK